MKQYITYILALLLLTACSSTDDFPTSSKESTALVIGDVTTNQSKIQSRAVNSGGTLTSGSIGLFLRESGSETYDSKTYNDIEYTYSNSAWTAASTSIILSETAGKLYAYYPYNSSYTTLTAIPLTSSVNDEDLCYSGAVDVSLTNPMVSLTLNHALARIDLTIKKGLAYSGDASLTAFKLSGDGVASTGTLNITSGSVSATAASFEPTITATNLTTDGTTYKCLVVPASTDAKNVNLACTVDNKTYINSLGSLTLTGGNAYTAEILLGSNEAGITVSSVTLGTWDSHVAKTVTVNGHTVYIAGNTDDICFNFQITDTNTLTITAVSTTSGSTVSAPSSALPTTSYTEFSAGTTGTIVTTTLTGIIGDVTVTY